MIVIAVVVVVVVVVVVFVVSVVVLVVVCGCSVVAVIAVTVAAVTCFYFVFVFVVTAVVVTAVVVVDVAITTSATLKAYLLANPATCNLRNLNGFANCLRHLNINDLVNILTQRVYLNHLLGSALMHMLTRPTLHLDDLVDQLGKWHMGECRRMLLHTLARYGVRHISAVLRQGIVRLAV